MLRLLLDGATIDRSNNVDLTLAIPTEDVVSIAGQSSRTLSANRQKKIRYTWAVELEAS